MILIVEGLAREVDDFFNFLFDCWSMIVEILVDEAVRVKVLVSLFTFQPSDQAVELANYVKQSLLTMGYILKHLFTVDAVVEVDVDEGLSDDQVVGVVGVSVSLHLFEFEIAEVG